MVTLCPGAMTADVGVLAAFDQVVLQEGSAKSPLNAPDINDCMLEVEIVLACELDCGKPNAVWKALATAVCGAPE